MKLKLFIFNFPAMGGDNEIQIYHHSAEDAEVAAKEIIDDIKYIEEKYSRYKTDSIISLINSQAGISKVQVDQETAALLDYSQICYQQSNGLFDITSGIFREVWNFKSDKIPSEKEVNKLLPLIGWEKVKWEKPFIFLTLKEMQIDFGGIGKEFAVDRAAGLLLQKNIKHALINLSGDIRVLGPQPGNKAWSIGIRDPRQADKTISSIDIMHGAVTTSGDYERSIERDGKRYSHILNPKTGWPVESFQSVTVVSESCLVAGSLCTLAMLKGETEGLKLLKEAKKSYIAIEQSGFIHKHML